MTEAKRFNGRKGSKKYTVLLVLRILERWSNEDHPIKQSQIVDFINNCDQKLGVDVWCDRKTVARHIKTLQQVGYKIVNLRGRGYYLENDSFTREERAEVRNAIMQSSFLTDERKRVLTAKLGYRQ